jgi:transcriptional regulator with XRE-family HTH domain
MEFDRKKLAKRLKDLREEKNITQEELSKILKVARTNIGKYENGDIDLNTSLLVKYSKFFDCSINYILGIDDQKTNSVRKNNENNNILQLSNDGDYVEIYKEYKESDLSLEELKEIIKLYSKIKNKNKKLT